MIPKKTMIHVDLKRKAIIVEKIILMVTQVSVHFISLITFVIVQCKFGSNVLNTRNPRRPRVETI